MQGLMLRSMQAYLRATFGAEVWAAVVCEATLPVDGFEPMLRYGDGGSVDAGDDSHASAVQPLLRRGHLRQPPRHGESIRRIDRCRGQCTRT